MDEISNIYLKNGKEVSKHTEELFNQYFEGQSKESINQTLKDNDMEINGRTY